jgi:hypothetical protein
MKFFSFLVTYNQFGSFMCLHSTIAEYYKKIIMQHFKTFSSILLLLITATVSAQIKKTDHFSKIIVSPYIQVTLVQGDEESVAINEMYVDTAKLHIEVNDNTLRIYLEGAKDFPGNEKDYSNGYKETHPLYSNTSVVATITYKTLEVLSLRGEEDQLCKGPINGDKFTLKVYGESNITFNEMNLQQLSATLYGESTLEIKAGSIKDQKYTCYGEGKINSLAIEGSTSHVTAFGTADFKLNVSNRIKITAYGDAELHYKGNPEINKGLHFGDMVIDKMD